MSGHKLNASQALILLPPTVITTAVAAGFGPVISDLAAMESLTVQSTFAWGSAGTKTSIWIQTSFDGGASWVDVISHTFTTAIAKKISSVKASIAVAASYTPGDKALADDTIKDGLLGSMLRVAYTTTGTYATSTTLSIFAVTKG